MFVCNVKPFVWMHENLWILFDFSVFQCSILHWNLNSKVNWYWRRAIDSKSPRAEIYLVLQTECHFPLYCFCNTSLAQRQNNSAFLTCLSPLSLPTPPAQSLHSQFLPPTLPPVSSNILIAQECLVHLLFTVFLTFPDVSLRVWACICAPPLECTRYYAYAQTYSTNTQTCTYTLDGNLACMITVTLSCLGVLSHLALVFAASFTLPTSPHLHRPFTPSSSPCFIPRHTKLENRGGAKGMIILRNLGLPTIRAVLCFLT